MALPTPGSHDGLGGPSGRDVPAAAGNLLAQVIRMGAWPESDRNCCGLSSPPSQARGAARSLRGGHELDAGARRRPGCAALPRGIGGYRGTGAERGPGRRSGSITAANPATEAAAPVSARRLPLRFAVVAALVALVGG